MITLKNIYYSTCFLYYFKYLKFKLIEKNPEIEIVKKNEGRKKYSDDFGVFVPSINCFIIFILGKIWDPLIKMVRNMEKKKNNYSKFTKNFIIIEVVNY